MKSKTLERCINQIFKPEYDSVMVNGHGDCSVCVYDEKNSRCLGYYPIKIKIYEVKENGKF